MALSVTPSNSNIYRRGGTACYSSESIYNHITLPTSEYLNTYIRTYIHIYINACIYILEKWFPLQGERAHSLCIQVKKKKGGGDRTTDLSIYRKVITFFTDYKYTT